MGITSTDARIVAVFKAVDSVIHGQGTSLLQRLAHIQLMCMFGSLEAIIKHDREYGHIHREPSYRNAQVAMDIYLSAQEENSTGTRAKIRQKRKRFSKRWSDLATPTPLFVLIYSDAAEMIMYVS